MFRFLTDPSPDRAFILSNAGIRKGDQPVAVPELSFKKWLVSRLLLVRDPDSPLGAIRTSPPNLLYTPLDTVS